MKFAKSFRIFFSFVLIAVWAGSAFPLGAHTYHTSLTLIDYNPKQKLVEISINLFTHDLIPVLERRAGKAIDLENTPNVDKLILDFVNENFVLKNKNGETKKLEWVGKELQIDSVYIYVEAASDEDLEGFSVQNTFFFDYFPEQINRVNTRYNNKKADLLFKPGDKFKEVKASQPKAEN